MEMPVASPAEEPKNPKTMFKLINPGGNPFGGGQNDRFKPAGMQVTIQSPKQNTAPPAPAQPSPAKAPMATPAMDKESDAKILARMESLLKIDKRVSELEEENEILLKMVNRVKAENDALKAENAALKAK